MRLEEVRDLLPLYALHALPEHERQALERALEHYPELLPELRALQETAADLTQAVPARAPAAEVKAKVMARIRQDSPGGVSVVPPTDPLGEPQPVLLPEGPRALWPRWVATIAAIAAILMIGWGAVRAYPWIEWTQASRDPQAKLETLVDEHHQPIGRAIFLPDGRCLIWTNLPPPSPGKTYQLWGVNGANHVGLETYRGGLIAFQMPEGYPIVHITEEKAGGSQTPSQIRALPEQN
jgi:hypothetical protein